MTTKERLYNAEVDMDRTPKRIKIDHYVRNRIMAKLRADDEKLKSIAERFETSTSCVQHVAGKQKGRKL